MTDTVVFKTRTGNNAAIPCAPIRPFLLFVLFFRTVRYFKMRFTDDVRFCPVKHVLQWYFYPFRSHAVRNAKTSGVMPRSYVALADFTARATCKWIAQITRRSKMFLSIARLLLFSDNPPPNLHSGGRNNLPSPQHLLIEIHFTICIIYYYCCCHSCQLLALIISRYTNTTRPKKYPMTS